MAGNAYLAAEHTPFAYLGRTGHTYLCGHYRVRTYLVVVGYLDEVVQLHTAMYDGGSHRGAVHARISSYLYIIFEDDNADLWNFFIAFGGRGKSETISTDDASCMQNAVVAHAAVVIDCRTRIKDTMAAYTCSGTDCGTRMKGGAVAYFHSVAHISEGTDVNVLSHLGCGGHIGQRVDTLQLRFALLVERHQLRKALIGVFHLDKGRFYFMFGFEVLVHQDNAGLRLVDIGSVFRIGQERQCAGYSFLDFGEGMYGRILVSHDFSLYIGSYLFG